MNVLWPAAVLNSVFFFARFKVTVYFQRCFQAKDVVRQEYFAQTFSASGLASSHILSQPGAFGSGGSRWEFITIFGHFLYGLVVYVVGTLHS